MGKIRHEAAVKTLTAENHPTLGNPYNMIILPNRVCVFFKDLCFVLALAHTFLKKI